MFDQDRHVVSGGPSRELLEWNLKSKHMPLEQRPTVQFAVCYNGKTLTAEATIDELTPVRGYGENWQLSGHITIPAYSAFGFEKYTGTYRSDNPIGSFLFQ